MYVAIILGLAPVYGKLPMVDVVQIGTWIILCALRRGDLVGTKCGIGRAGNGGYIPFVSKCFINKVKIGDNLEGPSKTGITI